MKTEKILGVIPVLVFLAVWEATARAGFFPEYLFPPFSHVMATMYVLVASGILVENFISSLLRVLAGFILGAVAGIGVGIIMGYNETVNRALHPIFSLLMPIPALGWLPLLMLWIGVGEALPVTIIFLCSFFPILYNTVTGIRSVSEEIISVARTLGASKKKILTTILLPLAVSNIFTGLRLEAGMAWRVIIAAEMVAIPTGIGALLISSESLLRVDVIMVCLIVLSLMCLSFEKALLLLERRIARWR